MSASSVLLSADVLLFPEQTHIYRRYANSPTFAQSFAAHLAAFASLDRSTRERVLDNAPAVLSCEVKGQGSVKQPGHSASLGSKALDVDSMDRCGQHPVYNGYATFPIVSQPLSSHLNSFPYDMDFTPWLQFDDSASEPMEIDENQSQSITDAHAPTRENRVASDTNNSATSPPTTPQNRADTDSAILKSQRQRARVDDLKIMIEDSLVHMHTKLVEDGDMDSGFGKAFTCIFDHQPDIREDKESPEFKSGGDPISRFFEIICTKFSHLSSVLTSKMIEGGGGLNLLRICCEWVLLETLCYTCLGVVAHRRWLAAPAQELYTVSREGVESFQPLPMNGAKPWRDLHKVDSAPLDSWTLRRGYIVEVDTGHSTSFAKVSDIRCLDDGRYIVVYTWLYTRQQITEELEVDGILSPRCRAHLDKMWPLGVRYKYMLSTNRTITLWDTAIGRAPEEVSSSLCYSGIYSTTPSSRKIWSVENPRYRWMKRILLYEPQE